MSNPDSRWERPAAGQVILVGLTGTTVLIQRNARRQWEPWIDSQATGAAYANLTDARWDTEEELRDRGHSLPDDVPFEDSRDDDDGGWCENWEQFLAAQE